MTVCVPTVVFDRCGVIARRRSRAVLRRGSMKSESLAIGVAGTKCETLTMPSECRSRDVDNEHSPAIVEIVGGDIVAESAVDEIKAAVVAPKDEFRPADASSVAWCMSWPDSWKTPRWMAQKKRPQDLHPRTWPMADTYFYCVVGRQ